MAANMTENKNQTRAVNESGNLIVSAGAGAGKTTVLTSRVLRLVEEGMGVDALLILTFTRAAAAEMKSRIEARLTDRAQTETDPQKRAYLQRQLLLCPAANISTIDSFCASVVRRFYYLEGLAPGMGTVTETEAAVLLNTAAEEAMAERTQTAPEEYRALLRAFGGNADIKDMLLTLHRFITAQPDRDAWLAETELACRDNMLTKQAEARFFRAAQKELRSAIGDFSACLESLPDYAKDKYKPYASTFLPQLRGALLADTAEAYGASLSAVSFAARLPVIQKKTDTAGVCDRFKALRDGLKAAAAAQCTLFSDTEEDVQEAGAVSNITGNLLRLLKAVEAGYAALKLEKGKLDFADMEYYCVRLLGRPEVAAEYRDRFRAIIVDEYQDSNRLQERILDAIRREDNLFLVGDVKQSIYAFRMAEPELFLEKTERYGRNEGGRRIDLNCNFRSSEAVLDAVNGVFSRLMREETGDIVYSEKEFLRPGTEQPAGSAGLHIIDCGEAGQTEADGDTAAEEPDASEAEALFCAETIRSLIKKERFSDRDGNERPYTYRDFAILLRSRSRAALFASILAEEGIPCFAEAAGGYFNSIETQLFLNMLRIIDNRRQDVPLVSVMRSLIGGFSDEELVALRKLVPEKNTDFIDCLTRAAETDNGCRAALFLQKLEAWRKMSLYMPMRALCSLLLDETGLLRDMSALPGGAGREANLCAMLSLAGEYDASGAFGLHGFLSYADKAREADKTAAAPSVAADAVRIMTVHGSKGLEFPVVFYADLAHKFNREDTTKDLLLDNGLGIGLRFTDEAGVKHTPRLYRLLKSRIHLKALEEELRVLYVGMTRAVRRLYMVGSMRNAREKADDVPPGCPAGEVLSAASPLRLLLLARTPALPLSLHDKAVYTRTRPEAPRLPAPDEKKLADFSQKLARVYPHPLPAGLPNKTSASALEETKKAYMFAETPFDQKQSAALGHGTRLHTLLERLPLSPEKAAERERLLSPLPPWDKSAIGWFLGTDLWKRMQHSPVCRRELAFTTALDSTLLGYGEGAGEVLLQGVIDCCFLEADGYVLLDYKTDAFRGNTPEAQAETHRRQLTLYARVLEKLTGKPVTEKYVVFLMEKTAVRL